TVATDGTAAGPTETRTVTTGGRSGALIEITSGLQAGDKVVVEVPAGFANRTGGEGGGFGGGEGGTRTRTGEGGGGSGGGRDPAGGGRAQGTGGGSRGGGPPPRPPRSPPPPNRRPRRRSSSSSASARSTAPGPSRSSPCATWGCASRRTSSSPSPALRARAS